MRSKGALARERKNHLARQRIYDALKRLAAGDEVVVSLHGQRYRVVPIKGDETELPIVLYSHNGRIGIGDASTRSVAHYVSRTGYGRVLPDKIHGRVVETF